MLRTSERRRIAAPLVVVVAVAAGIGVWIHHRSGSAIATSQALIAKDSAFVNGPAAGAAFARISQRMFGDAKHCASAHGDTDPRCVARFQAAAYANVTAVALLSCTAPGVYEARHLLYDELSGIASLDHRRLYSVPPPTVPKVPAC